jgi:hypothetical protein
VSLLCDDVLSLRARLCSSTHRDDRVVVHALHRTYRSTTYTFMDQGIHHVLGAVCIVEHTLSWLIRQSELCRTNHDNNNSYQNITWIAAWAMRLFAVKARYIPQKARQMQGRSVFASCEAVSGKGEESVEELGTCRH